MRVAKKNDCSAGCYRVNRELRTGMKHMNNMSGDTDALGHREFERPSLNRGALAGEAEILWDQFGPDVLTVVRVENHAERT